MTEPLPFNPNVSRGASAVELCACGHKLDHRGRKCGHENCPCEEGVRVDVATGLQTKPVVKENGGLNVEVARVKDTQPLIVVPK